MPIAITSIKNVPLQVQKNSQKPKPKSVCDTQYSTEQNSFIQPEYTVNLFYTNNQGKLQQKLQDITKSAKSS